MMALPLPGRLAEAAAPDTFERIAELVDRLARRLEGALGAEEAAKPTADTDAQDAGAAMTEAWLVGRAAGAPRAAPADFRGGAAARSSDEWVRRDALKVGVCAASDRPAALGQVQTIARPAPARRLVHHQRLEGGREDLDRVPANLVHDGASRELKSTTTASGTGRTQRSTCSGDDSSLSSRSARGGAAGTVTHSPSP